ncbi:MAG: TetR family transcriptional regulator [Mycobacterium sp.]
MSDLTEDLGVSKSTVFHHFDGKESILAAALDEALEALAQIVTDARDPGENLDAYQRLRGAIDADTLTHVIPTASSTDCTAPLGDPGSTDR